jgi:hypothetical protein
MSAMDEEHEQVMFLRLQQHGHRGAGSGLNRQWLWLMIGKLVTNAFDFAVCHILSSLIDSIIP